jgi:hypothetical protein
MDITVRRTGEEAWSLEDLLGRPMGSIAEDRPKHFTIPSRRSGTANDARPQPCHKRCLPDGYRSR